MNLLDRARAYVNGTKILMDWLGHNAVSVHPQTAQARANVCLKCPHNTPGVSIAEGVATAIKEHVELKNSLQLRVDGEKNLHTCSLCQCALRLKVHVPIAVIRGHMRPGEAESLPDFCWQKTEM